MSHTAEVLPRILPLRCSGVPMLDKSSEPNLLEKLVDHFGSVLAVHADVLEPKWDEFLSRVGRTFSQWDCDIVFEPESGNPDRVLYQMLRNARGLEDQLLEINRAGKDGLSDLLLNVGFRLQQELEATAYTDEDKQRSTYEVHHIIRHLIIAIESALDKRRTRPKGALPGIKGYPGLDVLVFGLGRDAFLCGGKFTAHRKLGPKGSLVKALDEIRKWLEDSEGGELHANSLPRRLRGSTTAIPGTAVMERQPATDRLIRLDASELHHLGPLLGFVGEELTEVGG